MLPQRSRHRPRQAGSAGALEGVVTRRCTIACINPAGRTHRSRHRRRAAGRTRRCNSPAGPSPAGGQQDGDHDPRSHRRDAAHASTSKGAPVVRVREVEGMCRHPKSGPSPRCRRRRREAHAREISRLGRCMNVYSIVPSQRPSSPSPGRRRRTSRGVPQGPTS